MPVPVVVVPGTMDNVGPESVVVVASVAVVVGAVVVVGRAGVVVD